MALHSTSCKFCHRPITVEIDDDYASLGDPFKIIPLASCDHCADLRVERRGLEFRLARASSIVSLLPVGEAKKREAMRAILERLTRAYAKLIARWHRMDGELWEPGIVDQIMDNPLKWGNTIGHMWRAFKDWQRSQAQASLPYKET